MGSRPRPARPVPLPRPKPQRLQPRDPLAHAATPPAAGATPGPHHVTSAQRLFALSPLAGGEAAVGSSAFGASAELRAAARLLELGHKVAIPVVDDDGVDLVVDYRLRAQVKTCLGLTSGQWTFELRPNQADRRAGKSPRRNADFYILFAADVAVWWIIPDSNISSRATRIVIVPGERRDREWREAWNEIKGWG